ADCLNVPAHALFFCKLKVAGQMEYCRTHEHGNNAHHEHDFDQRKAGVTRHAANNEVCVHNATNMPVCWCVIYSTSAGDPTGCEDGGGSDTMNSGPAPNADGRASFVSSSFGW